MTSSGDIIWLIGVPNDRGNEVLLMAAIVGYCSKYWGMAT